MQLWNLCLTKSKGKLEKSFGESCVRSVLAGAVVAFFGFCSAWVGAVTGSSVLTGMTFSLALLTILSFKLELFTGNCLLAVCVVEKQCGWQRPTEKLWISFFGNMVGGSLMALALLWLALPLGGAPLQENLLKSISIKTALPWPDAFFRGIGCNLIVCAGVLSFWLLRGWQKIAVTSLLITLFVMASYEHIVANFLYWTAAVWFGKPINWLNFIAATFGNIGGGLLVVYGLYWMKRE